MLEKLSSRHERKMKLFYPKANFLLIVKISAEFCWIQNVLYACTRMSGLRLRKPELPNFQGCQTVFEINVKRKRDFNVFLQIHVSIFCAEPSINILDQLSCLGLVFVIFTYFLCHFYVTCCYMIPFKQIVFPKSKCHEPQLFCLFAKLLLFREIF